MPLNRYRRRGVGIRVQEEQGDLERRLPVDERVVHARDDAAASALEPRGEPDLPERTIARQRLGEDAVAEEREAAVVEPGVRDAEHEHVARHVEAGVVDPERLAHARRWIGEPRTEARDQLEPGVECEQIC